MGRNQIWDMNTCTTSQGKYGSETYINIQNPTHATEKWMPRKYHAKQLTNKNNLPASLPSQLGKNLLGQQQQCPLETYAPGQAADFCP